MSETPGALHPLLSSMQQGGCQACVESIKVLQGTKFQRKLPKDADIP